MPPPRPNVANTAATKQRVFVLGATGTIGQATVKALLARGHDVVCLVRGRAGIGAKLSQADTARLLDGATVRFGDVTDPHALAQHGFCGERFDALISCLASRTGVPRDAWAIDHQAHVDALAAAENAGVKHVVLLSAICVQKPLLEFQKAKLAFENHLVRSGLTYSIVRPTAFFKSLSGQIKRVQDGKPFLLIGDGRATAFTPISDADLGAYLADCLDAPERRNQILPIGGPGDAMTPRQQGETLFALLGREPKFKHVPVAVLDAVIFGLSMLGRIIPAAADKAELARIGRYYATESMLVWDQTEGRYDAAATPATGTETLTDYYARVLAGEEQAARGDHAVF